MLDPATTTTTTTTTTMPSTTASTKGPTTPALAALAAHIDARVRPRDATKARGLDGAVALLATLGPRAPDVDGLAALAACLHGVDAPRPLRTSTAFAHGGRAVMRPFTRAELVEVVGGAAAVDDGPSWFRAARLYADVCFFHPFDDGNARLALCALVWVLQREGVAVVDLGPLVMPWTPSSTPSLLRVVRALCRG